MTQTSGGGGGELGPRGKVEFGLAGAEVSGYVATVGFEPRSNSGRHHQPESSKWGKDCFHFVDADTESE